MRGVIRGGGKQILESCERRFVRYMLVDDYEAATSAEPGEAKKYEKTLDRQRTLIK